MKTYYRQAAVARRYGVKPRTILRMRREGRLPPPDFFLGPYPLWSDETLTTFETSLKPSPEKSENDLGAENLGAGQTNSA
jgi:hypothetical protein